MRTACTRNLGLTCGAFVLLSLLTATAEETSKATNVVLPPTQTERPAASTVGVKEVLEMMQAGVSARVVQEYVEAAPAVAPLTAADIIALKKKEVPDEITTAMLRRAAKLQNPATASGQGGQSRQPSARPAAGRGTVDPEGYDFWWYHYAYPRALAAANQRVASSYYSFGNPYYPVITFRPLPGGRFAPGR